MCLVIDFDLTEENLLNPNQEEEITFWKILIKESSPNPTQLYSIYWPHKWSPGINRLNKHSERICLLPLTGEVVCHGFHVYTSEEEANICLRHLLHFHCYITGPKFVVVAVTAKRKDIVAYGDKNDAVCIQITLPYEEYDRHTKIE